MKPKLIWPGLLFLLLGLNGAIVGVTIRLATHDASFSVEPEYDRQAMQWDQTAQQTVQNHALGWSIDLAIEKQSDGTTLATVHLRDKDSQPLIGTSVKAIAFHSGRAANRQSLLFQEHDDGTLAAPIEIDRSGLWEFRLVVAKGAQRFAANLERQVDLHAGAKGGP